jgi:hypothetical protein
MTDNIHLSINSSIHPSVRLKVFYITLGCFCIVLVVYLLNIQKLNWLTFWQQNLIFQIHKYQVLMLDMILPTSLRSTLKLYFHLLGLPSGYLDKYFPCMCIPYLFHYSYTPNRLYPSRFYYPNNVVALINHKLPHFLCPNHYTLINTQTHTWEKGNMVKLWYKNNLIRVKSQLI